VNGVPIYSTQVIAPAPSDTMQLAMAVEHHANSLMLLTQELKRYNDAQDPEKKPKPKVVWSTAKYEEENPVDVALRKQEAKLRRGAQGK
jgi:hypothetical protein